MVRDHTSSPSIAVSVSPRYRWTSKMAAAYGSDEDIEYSRLAILLCSPPNRWGLPGA